MKRLLAILTSLTILCGVAQAMPPPPQYSVVDLGTLGGPNVQVTGINSTGQVIGNADGAVAGTGYAFLWTAPGPMVSLGALGALPTQSNAAGINDSGSVVGQSNREAFLYTAQNGMQALGFLPGGTESEAYAINDSGTVVGGATTVGVADPNAFVWDQTNGLRNLNNLIVNPPSGWLPNAATAISQNGLIAGDGQAAGSSGWPPSNQHAFVLNGGSMTVLPSLGTGVYPESINASGDVAGVYFDSQGQHAFLYTPAGGTKEIGDPSAPIAAANVVTDSGLVLGGITLADGSEYAFLYLEAGGMVDLNSLVKLNGWTLNDATGINQRGQIVCDGVNSSNVLHAFLLTPVPEPSSFDLGIAASFAALIFRLRWRHKLRAA